MFFLFKNANTMWIDLQEKQIKVKLGEPDDPTMFRKEEEMAEAYTFDEVVEWEGDVPRLKKEYAELMEIGLEEIDDALQYALIATQNGDFYCKPCPGKKFFLKEGEVWRYGMTRKGEKGRYSEVFLDSNNLKLIVQCRGTTTECLKQERWKIFNYPLLPENLARPNDKRLVKPPGNLRTD